jgi:hypothetical protein
MLEMPWGRVEPVLDTASSFVSTKAGLARRLWDLRRSQTLMILIRVESAMRREDESGGEVYPS